MKESKPNLTVFLHNEDSPVAIGRLGYKNRESLFEYDLSFLSKGIEISPFYLPLKTGVLTSKQDIFDGLFGVFNDSLPDGWGRLLIDRNLRKQGIESSQLTPLDRLSQCGSHGMGALEYKPDNSPDDNRDELNLDKISSHVADVLSGDTDEMLEDLISLGGSSSGARPKIMAGISKNKKQIIHGTQELPDNFEHWIIKFRSFNDSENIASIEYAYSLMARDAGIDIPQTHLFTTSKKKQYFGVKRFDRSEKKKIHMHSISGLLHADHRYPSLDYQDILKATFILTKDIREVKKMFQIAVFNILSFNRDDHAKNFSFLMDKTGVWKVAPAYDLTFSSGPGGEHSTMVMGEGKNPTTEHLMRLGVSAGLKKSEINLIIDQTKNSINKWSIFTGDSLLDKKSISHIWKYIKI